MIGKKSFRVIFTITGAIGLALGLVGNTWAGGCFSQNAISTGNVGSKTTCSNYASQLHLVSCTIPAGGNSCAVSVDDGDPTTGGGPCTATITTTDYVNTTEEVSFIVTGDCRVTRVLAEGQQQGSYCDYGYGPQGAWIDTVYNTDNKGDKSVIKNAEFCVAEAYQGLQPSLQVEKRVNVVDTKGTTDPSDDTWSCLDATSEITVPSNASLVYCVDFANIGNAPIEVTLTDNNGTPPPGPYYLAPGESDAVEYFETVSASVVNTVTVEGVYNGETYSASDSAEVNVVVACDETTEGQADATNTLITSIATGTYNTCAPDGTPQLLCDMVLGDQPSGNWCVGGQPVANPEGNPYCREVWADRNKDCIEDAVPIKGEAVQGQTVYVGTVNPTIMTFCASGGGSNSCIIYCFTDGTPTDRAECPEGSFVY